MTAKPFTLSTIARRIVELIVEGHSVKAVATMTGRSQATVNYHLRRAADAWQLDRSRNLRVQLARRVAEHALTQLLIARAEETHDHALMTAIAQATQAVAAESAEKRSA